MNAERIKNLREDFDLTQEAISEILGCKRAAYSLWELDRNTIPLHYLNEFSNYFDVNIDYLVYLSDEKSVPFNRTQIDRIELGRRIRMSRKAIK